MDKNYDPTNYYIDHVTFQQMEDKIRQLQIQNTELIEQRKTLLWVLNMSLRNHEAVYDAINKLAEDVWGVAEPDPDHHPGYFYRDEILHSIACVIKRIKQIISKEQESDE